MMNLEHKKACNKESLAKVVEHASGKTARYSGNISSPGGSRFSNTEFQGQSLPGDCMRRWEIKQYL